MLVDSSMKVESLFKHTPKKYLLESFPTVVLQCCPVQVIFIPLVSSVFDKKSLEIHFRSAFIALQKLDHSW